MEEEEEEWGKVPQEVDKYGASARDGRRGWKMAIWTTLSLEILKY